jgi:hypothetical protein
MSPCDNGWRSFDFDYYRQGTLNAMPKGLPDIQYSFDPAKISMNPFYVADSLQTESIEFDPSSFDWPDAFTNYMLDNLDFTSPYLRHLFAVSYFVKPAVPPNPPILMDYILGTTWTFGYPSTDWASFVQVEGINYIFQNSDESEAVSSTTIHELVHIIARPPAINEACGDWASQHVVGECVMEWLDFDSTSGALLLMCDKPVYITWPYTDQICDSCLVRLENAPW